MYTIDRELTGDVKTHKTTIKSLEDIIKGLKDESTSQVKVAKTAAAKAVNTVRDNNFVL